MKETFEVGRVFVNKKGLKFEITELISDGRVPRYKIKFQKTGYETEACLSSIKKGTVRDFFEKTIYGVACKGHTTCSSKFQKIAFSRWEALISRCYNEKDSNYRSYGGKGVKVDERWLCFENFIEDIQLLEGYDKESYISGAVQLDKDCKFDKNATYSKDTCIFIDKKINMQTQPSKAKKMYATNGNDCYEFENIALFAREFNLKDRQIQRALSSGKCYSGFYFRYEGDVVVRRITDWSIVVDMARFTVNKEDSGKEPSQKFKDRICKAEHSPLRTLMYIVELDDIPTWVSQHIARHDAFAYHTVRDGAHDTHFVGTQRGDRTGIDRNKLPQDAPCCHRIFLSAQDLITISRLRLCRMASPETRKLWETVRDKIAKIDPEVAKNMVPNCVYKNGFCGEMKPCGYCFSKEFKDRLNKYLEGSAWLEMNDNK